MGILTVRRAVYAVSLCAVALTLAVGSQPAFAGDYYKWVDKNGDTHFADSPASIPPEYRKKSGGPARHRFEPVPPKSTVREMSEGDGASSPSRAVRRDKTRQAPVAGGGSPIHYTDANFDKLALRSGKFTLVEFWATWCGPCRRIAPVIEQLAGEFSGKANIGKMDIDRNKKITRRYGITSIPAMLFFKDGKVVNKLVGYKSIGVLRRIIQDGI